MTPSCNRGSRGGKGWRARRGLGVGWLNLRFSAGGKTNPSDRRRQESANNMAAPA